MRKKEILNGRLNGYKNNQINQEIILVNISNISFFFQIEIKKIIKTSEKE